MFERFTEKARRVVFHARYEASQYGSSYIETEHLLLGLWREDLSLRTALDDSEVRSEIERWTMRREPVSTSIEMPLSSDSQKVLHFAAQEADRLGQRPIGTEHLLLGLLHVKDSLGARIARLRGLNPEEFRERVAKAGQPVSYRKPSLPILEEFLTGLKWPSSDYLMSFFAKYAQLVDVFGNQWSYAEIAAGFEDLFAPYAKRNAAYVVEETLIDSDDRLVAVVLWKNALLASMERVWMHRMTVVLLPEGDDWAIVSIHVTPVQP
jgi:hypothetical protein